MRTDGERWRWTSYKAKQLSLKLEFLSAYADYHEEDKQLPQDVHEVNAALAIAKSNADEANLDKTRFLAAASHDILQPLNAARLYATSLAERPLASGDAALARNLDLALQSVEEILSALIDISRMDAGRIEPELSPVPLQDLFEQLEVEFGPAAREKGLNALRQWIDEIDAGRYPGLYLVITGTPAFFDGPQGVQRLAPLAQRLHVDLATDRRFDNPRAVQIRLSPFDHAV